MTGLVVFLPALLANQAATLTSLHCLEGGGSVCEVMRRCSRTLVTPQECSPQVNVPLSPETEFQSNYGQFSDIPCLTTDPVFMGQFCDLVRSSIIVEIIGPYFYFIV